MSEGGDMGVATVQSALVAVDRRQARESMEIF